MGWIPLMAISCPLFTNSIAWFDTGWVLCSLCPEQRNSTLMVVTPSSSLPYVHDRHLTPLTCWTGRKFLWFSHLFTLVISCLIRTKIFCRDTRWVGECTYQLWRISPQPTSSQKFVLISLFFSSSFCTLCKFGHKNAIHTAVQLKHGTHKSSSMQISVRFWLESDQYYKVYSPACWLFWLHDTLPCVLKSGFHWSGHK